MLSQCTRSLLELKRPSPDLLPAVAALDKLCLGGIWTPNGYRQELNNANSDLLVICIPDSEAGSFAKPPSPTSSPTSSPVIGVGCLWSVLEEAHIIILAIHSDYCRQGLGQAMLYALLYRAWQRQLEWATLEVRSSNEPALSLYRKFGFEFVGRRKRYYQETGEDALILWRSGLQKPEFDETLAIWAGEIRDRLAASGWTLRAVGLADFPIETGLTH
ncbi:MAG: ribosomal protein S18-alanine N-acetyltransferase [Oscillatoria sp. SIO1A7]|nr:ribosomal protein S18-alanine N-acetyltransferase [Oscillatoria sp. SIO1A7]